MHISSFIHRTSENTDISGSCNDSLSSQLIRLGPPGPKQLRCSAKTVARNILVSPITKNLVGAAIATGAGVAMGCPLLVSVLLGIGVGTSWMCGAGLIISGVGLGIWILSTYASIQERKEGQSVAGHCAESLMMGLAGIPYFIVNSIYNGLRSCCSSDDSAQENGLPQQTLPDHPPAMSSRKIINTSLSEEQEPGSIVRSEPEKLAILSQPNLQHQFVETAPMSQERSPGVDHRNHPLIDTGLKQPPSIVQSGGPTMSGKSSGNFSVMHHSCFMPSPGFVGGIGIVPPYSIGSMQNVPPSGFGTFLPSAFMPDSGFGGSGAIPNTGIVPFQSLGFDRFGSNLPSAFMPSPGFGGIGIVPAPE